MSNINKIRLSGTTYNIQDSNATKTVTLTQAQYDALATKDANTLYIISDATGISIDSAITSGSSNAVESSAIYNALEGKANTATTYTKTEVDTLLDAKQDVSDMTAYTTTATTDALNTVVTAHTADTAIHVTSNEKATWNAKSDFSGSYNDLTDKPTIPTVPTSNTAFTNDAGYITTAALADYATTASVASKQDTLVSGTNIKTINNQSILGSGNITIEVADIASSAVTSFSITRDGNNEVSKFNYKRGLGATPDTANPMITINTINGQSVLRHPSSASTNFSLVETSAITTSMTSSSTDSQVPSAKAVYDQLGGLSLVKCTQAEYDALTTKDSNTLYVITTS